MKQRLYSFVVFSVLAPFIFQVSISILGVIIIYVNVTCVNDVLPVSALWILL